MTIDNAAGETSAAPRPWRARPAIRRPEELAKPLTREAIVKTATPVMNRRCRPKRSDARPPSSRKPPKKRV
jgi:hypothetical protein